MNNENSEIPVLNHTGGETAKKIYHAPSVKLYGSINDLVQGSGIRGADAGDDDTAGSV